jgi:nucleoside 2-deoxyribosyltransferase
MKADHKFFFAIPFDSATRALYDRVRDRIRQQYPGVTIVIGNEEVGPSKTYSDIASFKAQNRELTNQFVRQIQEADIVIADLTHNNPNVHVELGIALTENKNILRVTGRPVSELGFDVRNLNINQYKEENQLFEIIEAYCKTFFTIKALPMSKDQGVLYCEECGPVELRGRGRFDLRQIGPTQFKMRDGAIRVNFEILSTDTDDDWFGVYFRAADNPFLGSHLVYVRRNGAIEIAVYPGPDVLKTLPAGPPVSGPQDLTVQFENNYADVQMGSARLQTDQLSHQTVGSVLQAAWQADVKVYSAQMVCRDTIDWN